MIPVEFIHEPWLISEMEKLWFESDFKRYPKPVVDYVEAGKKGRAKIWAFRKNQIVKDESKRIVDIHTRNTNK